MNINGLEFTSHGINFKEYVCTECPRFSIYYDERARRWSAIKDLGESQQAVIYDGFLENCVDQVKILLSQWPTALTLVQELALKVTRVHQPCGSAEIAMACCLEPNLTERIFEAVLWQDYFTSAVPFKEEELALLRAGEYEKVDYEPLRGDTVLYAVHLESRRYFKLYLDTTLAALIVMRLPSL